MPKVNSRKTIPSKTKGTKKATPPKSVGKSRSGDFGHLWRKYLKNNPGALRALRKVLDRSPFPKTNKDLGHIDGKREPRIGFTL